MCISGFSDSKQQKLALTNLGKRKFIGMVREHRELREGWKMRLGNGEVVKASPRGLENFDGFCSRKNLVWILLLKWKSLNISSVFDPLLKIHIHRKDLKDWPNLANMPTCRKGKVFWFKFHVYIQWVKGKSSEGNQSTLGKRSRSWAARKQQMLTTPRIINNAAFPVICKCCII